MLLHEPSDMVASGRIEYLRENIGNRLHFAGRRVIFRWIFRNAHECGCFLFERTDATDHAITEPECTRQGQSRTIRTVGRWMAAGGPRA